MSTLSPQFVRTSSPTEMAFQDSNFQDPYLSAPLDPEEASFRSTAIRLTPMRGGDPTQNGMRDLSPSPSDRQGAFPHDHGLNPASLHAGNLNTFNASIPSSNFLSPRESAFSSPSAHTSPDTDYWGSVDMNLNCDQQHSLMVPQNMHTPGSEGFDSIEGAISTQLLSPDASYNPSPSPELTNTMLSVTTGDSRLSSPSFQHHSSGGTQHQQQTPSLITSPMSDNLSANWGAESARAVSPIVKVETYTRGDSPERDSFSRRRPSQSTMHLQVNEDDNDDGDDDNEPDDTGFSDSGHSIARSHDGSWVRDLTTGRAGIDPTSRDDIFVVSPAEMEIQREINEKNEGIRTWSASVSVANSEAGDDTPVHRGRKEHKGNRRRAKSAGDPSLQQDYFNYKYRYDDPTIPGPGILVHESSDEELSESASEWAGSGSESPPVSVIHTTSLEQHQPEDEENLPSQMLRGPPWQDNYDSASPAPKVQPQSSSAAMMEFLRRARDMETLSRAATWGTREADVNSIIGAGGSFENLSINDDHGKKQERRSSLRKFLPKKTASNLKRQLSEISVSHPNGDGVHQDEKASLQRKDSFPHYHGRKLSIGRSPKQSNLSAGGAMIAIASQMAAIGGRDSVRAVSPSKPSGNPWYSQKTRGRSRSEIPRPSSPGLVDLMTSHGGPPVANIAYPTNSTNDQPAQPVRPEPRHDAGDDDDDDDDENVDDKGLVMDFPVLASLPVPTIDGFKTQISQLNPRLQPALLERFANEQLKRYRKLVDGKLNHGRAVSNSNCTAGQYCFAQGGEAKMLAPRASPQDDSAHTQFQIPGQGTVDGNPQALGESTVTAAQFPLGVPLPPVQRLPAEFECPVCFRVKKFQKPSDWTKHIHEDVQPFTCTFAHCSDPKSFKRKADWVRHETERHRKLEWWSCTVPDCHHTCYRKDNFVQHLVREHKLPEPKVKKSKSKNSKDQPDIITPEMQEEANRERGIEILWELVENCRHDTPKNPREEPCRFCGNVCSSWKKLTVHLAKHMEQIAMPVLALVKERDLPVNTLAEFNPAGLNTNAHGTAGLPPYPNGIKHEQEGKLNNNNNMDMTQGPYSNNSHQQPTGLAMFTPTYPPPHLTTTLSSGFISAEPESYNGNAFDEVPEYLDVDLPRSAGGETQFMPLQQNSVTYPPPSQPMSRPRTPNLGVPNQYHLPIPSTEPMIDPQGQFCMSPGAESNYSHPTSIAQTLSYDSSMVTDYTQTCEPHYM